MARCCRTNKCSIDIDCTCPDCTEYTSIDDDHDNYELLNQHSVHLGIVNFYPLFYGLVDDEKVLEKLFDLLEDETRMLSPYGVRSLSARDQFYQQDSATYRGNVFVHLNYLLLKGLKTYYSESSVSMKEKPELVKKASELYLEIKKRLVATVFEQWKKDGQFWEMYDSENGQGQGTAPFNGWTSLVLLIVNDLYD